MKYNLVFYENRTKKLFQAKTKPQNFYFPSETERHKNVQENQKLNIWELPPFPYN